MKYILYPLVVILLSPLILLLLIGILIALPFILLDNYLANIKFKKFMQTCPDKILFLYKYKQNTHNTITSKILHLLNEYSIEPSQIDSKDSKFNLEFPNFVKSKILSLISPGNPWLISIKGGQIKHVSLSGLIGFIQQSNPSAEQIKVKFTTQLEQLKTHNEGAEPDAQKSRAG